MLNNSLAHGRLLGRLAALCIVASIPTLAHAQLVACDLVDRQLALTLLQSPIKQHSPSRQIQTTGPAASSECVYFAQRSNLRTRLFEYPSQADAIRAFRDATSSGGAATYDLEKDLGDEARWWSIGSEAHGLLVRKGKRIFMLDTRWHDSLASADAKARLKPYMPSVTSKL